MILSKYMNQDAEGKLVVKARQATKPHGSRQLSCECFGGDSTHGRVFSLKDCFETLTSSQCSGFDDSQGHLAFNLRQLHCQTSEPVSLLANRNIQQKVFDHIALLLEFSH